MKIGKETDFRIHFQDLENHKVSYTVINGKLVYLIWTQLLKQR